MPFHDLHYKVVKPEAALADLVESFWMLSNHSDQERAVVIVPDGRIDVFFSSTGNSAHHVLLRGLDTEPGPSTIPPKSTTFAISLTLLAPEYLLNQSIAPFVNKGTLLPPDFWGVSDEDLTDFDQFCAKVTAYILGNRPIYSDDRKRKLIERVTTAQGAVLVSELAEKVGWSSRQINRYFTRWFGLPLKTYCSILRFRASIGQLQEGKLFPEQNFADQAHFIHEIRKYTGVIPKKLGKKADDRFIQFSLLPKP